MNSYIMHIVHPELLIPAEPPTTKLLVVQEAWSLLKLFGSMQDIELEPDNVDEIQFSIQKLRMQQYQERQNKKIQQGPRGVEDSWEPAFEYFQEDVTQSIEYYQTPIYTYGNDAYGFYFDQLPEPTERYLGVGYVALHARDYKKEALYQTVFRLHTHPHGPAVFDNAHQEITSDESLWGVYDLLCSIRHHMWATETLDESSELRTTPIVNNDIFDRMFFVPEE